MTKPSPQDSSEVRAALQLPAESGSLCEVVDYEHFGEPRLSCSPVFDDILYSPADDPVPTLFEDKSAFWLLPEPVANAIRESAYELGELVGPGKTPEQRKQGLDASGLLEYFLEPCLSLFLEGDDKARMQAIEAKAPRIQDLNRYEEAELQAIIREPSRPQLRQRFNRLNEWRRLVDRAVAEAERQGYRYREGHLFTPQAEEARAAVAEYNAARQRLLEEFDSPAEALAEVESRLRESKQRYEKASQCSAEQRQCRREMIDYLLWQDSYKSRFNYIESILKVANYGLAVPEYALIDDPQTGVGSGISRFRQYLELLDKQRKLEQRLQERYQHWVAASGENVPPPAGLLEAEREQWNDLQKQHQQLKDQAAAQVARSTPRRQLLWNPETFTPNPLERLVKTGFPLREISLPSSPGRPVQHLSLDFLRSLRPSISFAGNADGKAAKDHASSDFHDWLRSQGAVRIAAQGDWFDHEGWFDEQRFLDYLRDQGYRVHSLADAGARHAWAEQLRQMLFKADVQKRLRLFDASPQAQLVRCLTPAQEELHTGVELDGPSLSHEGLTASAKVSLDINLARGEVQLFSLDLPERPRAQEVSVPYQVEGDPTTRQLAVGRFSLHLSARAWGFAGASLLLSGELQIGPGNLGLGASVDPIEPASRTPGTLSTAGNASSGQLLNGAAAQVQIKDGAKASFNLFAGVQAGILTTGALNWAPPKARVVLRNVPNDPGRLVSSDGWCSLARLEGELAAAAGVGGNGEFNLSLSEGRLLLRIKASLVAGAGMKGSLTFQVGYEAIGELLNLVRRELHNNQQRPLQWVTPQAMDFLSRLNTVGALGLDVGMVYLLNLLESQVNAALQAVDKVMGLYEAITGGGKGGPIAYAIMTYKKPGELEQWFVEAMPSALGPMLMTLLSEPAGFDVMVSTIEDGKPAEKPQHYDKEQSHLFQQQAIERILDWIVTNAERTNRIKAAQNQFGEACSRMDRFGALAEKPGQAYCENRRKMDRFMAVVPNTPDAKTSTSDAMRESYKQYAKVLGALRDGYCRVNNYYGKDLLASGSVTYTGSGE